jgi:hypothetical protein
MTTKDEADHDRTRQMTMMTMIVEDQDEDEVEADHDRTRQNEDAEKQKRGTATPRRRRAISNGSRCRCPRSDLGKSQVMLSFFICAVGVVVVTFRQSLSMTQRGQSGRGRDRAKSLYLALFISQHLISTQLSFAFGPWSCLHFVSCCPCRRLWPLKVPTKGLLGYCALKITGVDVDAITGQGSCFMADSSRRTRVSAR